MKFIITPKQSGHAQALRTGALEGTKQADQHVAVPVLQRPDGTVFRRAWGGHDVFNVVQLRETLHN